MLFEDPDGTRHLFDPGFTVARAKNPRLGKIDVVLLSSVHGDHLGSARIPNPGAGTCAKPRASVKMPDGNTADIIVGKKAKSYLGGEMRNFIRA